MHLSPRSYGTVHGPTEEHDEGSDSEEEPAGAKGASSHHADPLGPISTRNTIFFTPRPTQVDYEERLVSKYNRGRWEPDEDKALLAAVERFGSSDWNLVMTGVKGRTALQCADRYKGYLSPDHRRGMWTKEVLRAVLTVTYSRAVLTVMLVPLLVQENIQLVELVNVLGLHNWIEVAKGLPGRTAKQCNAKWFRCMDPSINRERWSDGENAILKHGHATFGTVLRTLYPFTSFLFLFLLLLLRQQVGRTGANAPWPHR